MDTRVQLQIGYGLPDFGEQELRALSSFPQELHSSI